MKKWKTRLIYFPKNLDRLLFSLGFTILVLSGCSTDFVSSPVSPSSTRAQAQYFLKLSQESSHAQSLGYRLQAADAFIQAREINEAQRVLRSIQINIPQSDTVFRKNILEIRLAVLKKDFSKARQFLKEAIDNLKIIEPSLPSEKIANDTNGTNGGLRVALLLPSKGPHAEAAKTLRDGFLAAYYKTKQQQQVPPSIKIYDTDEGSKIREAYGNALAEQAQVIVGPLTKSEVKVIADMKQLTIPVLALNTITEDPALPSRLYQFGLMPEDEVIAVAEQALRQGKRRVAMLAPQSDWGQRMASTFKHYWQSRGGKIVDVKFYLPQEVKKKVETLLQTKNNQSRHDVDMIFLAASPETARQIKPLLNVYAENIPVYATASIYTGTPSPHQDQDLNGIHFCDMPWVIQNNESTNKASAHHSPRFFALGMDAYQLALRLVSAERFPSYSFSGATGALRLNSYRRIQRELVCAKFEHGVPVPD